MKLHEFFENRLLMESSVTLEEVKSLKDLIDPKTGEYYTSEVNVTGDVQVYGKFTELPVKFGSVGGDFTCAGNRLTTLEGAPRKIGSYFACNSNGTLTSLEGIHKIIKKMNGSFICYGNPITSGGIGLILIEGITRVSADPSAFKIINKYLGQGKKGLLHCQDELIDAGFEEFAKL